MKKYSYYFIYFLVAMLVCMNTLTIIADEEETSSYPTITSSNSIEGWPKGPEIYSGAAVVIEAETGTVLYDKNMNEQCYPASITKILTGILTLENAGLNEMVEFSDEAVFSVPRNSSHIAITPGELLSVEDCMYGMMLASANEVANALAEHISGSVEKFVDLMNYRAKQLGAINTHFNNANGLPDDNHYTTCYDMAMISRAAVTNEAFIKINSTVSYMIPPTNLQPESRPVNTLHPLLINGSRHYDGCFGGKTGYTSVAGNTLVTFARRDGMTLICVVMKSDDVNVYTDSTALLNYGFHSFQKLNIIENETKFDFQRYGFFNGENSIFNSTIPEMKLNADNFIVLPTGIEFKEAESEVIFSGDTERDTSVFADIVYKYNGHYVGSTTLNVVTDTQDSFSFGNAAEASTIKTDTEDVKNEGIVKEKRVITINVWIVIGGLIVLFILWVIVRYLKFTRKRRQRRKRARVQKRYISRITRNRRRRRYSTHRLH